MLCRIYRIVPVLAAAMTCFAFQQSANADYFFYAGTGHYYGLTQSGENWEVAQTEAQSVGGYLATITSAGEQDFLVNTFVTGATPGGERQPFWIGLTDVNHATVAANQNFQWVTGEPLQFTAWNPVEPNDDTGDEWYTAFNFHYAFNQSNIKGTWNDTTIVGSVAPNPYLGIIEFNSNPNPVPEPGSLVLLGTGALTAIGAFRRRRRKTSFDRSTANSLA